MTISAPRLWPYGTLQICIFISFIYAGSTNAWSIPAQRAFNCLSASVCRSCGAEAHAAAPAPAASRACNAGSTCSDVAQCSALHSPVKAFVKWKIQRLRHRVERK